MGIISATGGIQRGVDCMRSLIEQVGGQGMAEIIVSLSMTSAVLPNCYFPNLKQYGHACDSTKAVFIFDEEQGQFLPYMPLDTEPQFVMLKDLARALKTEIED